INGYGLRESALVVILATFHVPAAMALLLALVEDAQVLLFGGIGGLIYLTMGMRRPAAKRRVAPAATS
ncbi:MAG: hypothetical protein IVW57_16965, partial [Ktedonobacterales bacterium]|nr:hypothetical protein [Ktedonobacterales bacterium]